MTTVVTYDQGVIMREIQLRDAKSGLSALLDEVVGGKPAVITRHGKREAVILSYQEWQRLSQVPSFGRLLMAAPLAPDTLPSRDTTPPRQTEF
jgi:antitoxin Phd